MNKSVYDRFYGDGTFSDETENITTENLEVEPEDMIQRHGMFHTCGFYFRMLVELRNVSKRNTDAVTKGIPVLPSSVAFESALEQWITSAEDWLPEWAIDCATAVSA